MKNRLLIAGSILSVLCYLESRQIAISISIFTLFVSIKILMDVIELQDNNIRDYICQPIKDFRSELMVKLQAANIYSAGYVVIYNPGQYVKDQVNFYHDKKSAEDFAKMMNKMNPRGKANVYQYDQTDQTVIMPDYDKIPGDVTDRKVSVHEFG